MMPTKVLIIDDERIIRRTTSLLLEKSGIDVICAANGMDGLTLARKERPNIILLDIMMPGVDGWETLKLIRMDTRLCSISVIVFTVCDYVLSEKKALGEGADGIVRKPFHLRKLLEILSSIKVAT